jgi:small subunit ribosomal protein S1
MDWTNRNVNPNKVVQLGDEVEVMILDIDEERRRISLGIKQCKQNPWEEFAEKFNKSDQVSGKIKSITDFGIFIGLDGGIDGLIHLSDLSWNDTGEDAVRNFQKGQEIEAVVLAVDPERERISLGVKQLEQDPFGQFVADNPKGSIVKGTVTEVDTKMAMVSLADGVDGILRASEYSRDRVEDLKLLIKVGEEMEAKFINIDRKARAISLSIKAKENDEEAEAMSDYSQSSAGPATTLGDLMKEQMGSMDNDQ